MSRHKYLDLDDCVNSIVVVEVELFRNLKTATTLVGKPAIFDEMYGTRFFFEQIAVDTKKLDISVLTAHCFSLASARIKELYFFLHLCDYRLGTVYRHFSFAV